MVAALQKELEKESELILTVLFQWYFYPYSLFLMLHVASPYLFFVFHSILNQPAKASIYATLVGLFHMNKNNAKFGALVAAYVDNIYMYYSPPRR